MVVAYTSTMRRIQIYLDEALDEALQSEAARTGRSKASLIRECVSSRYRSKSASAFGDPLDALIGSVDIEPADVDEVLYGGATAAPGSSPRKTHEKADRRAGARRRVHETR